MAEVSLTATVRAGHEDRELADTVYGFLLVLLLHAYVLQVARVVTAIPRPKPMDVGCSFGSLVGIGRSATGPGD